MVEDNASDVDLMKIASEDCAFKMRLNVCEDGEKAIEYLRKQGSYVKVKRPDLILLDLNLPKMTGHEVLEEIKNDPLLRTIPVIILTTAAREVEIKRIATYSSTRFLTKPFRFSEYKNIIRSIEEFWLSAMAPTSGMESRI